MTEEESFSWLFYMFAGFVIGVMLCLLIGGLILPNYEKAHREFEYKQCDLFNQLANVTNHSNIKLPCERILKEGVLKFKLDFEREETWK